MGIDLERPSKRQKLLDEGDAQTQSQKAAKSEQLLRSRWESVFEKYGHDFDDISDVVDLRSGTVSTDKGHLRSLRHERDIGRRKVPARAPPATPPWRRRSSRTIAGSDDDESEDELSSPVREVCKCNNKTLRT